MAQRVAGGANPVRILVVQPDEGRARALAALLAPPRFTLIRVATAAEAKAAFAPSGSVDADLVIQDLALPDDEGLLLCADLRSRTSVPLMVVADETEATARVLAFKLGADDVISHSTDPDELLARIGALLRRASASPRPAGQRLPVGAAGPAPRQQLGALTIDRLRGRAMAGESLLALTPAQYRLLSAFMSRAGEVLSRADLARAAGNYPHLVGTRSVDVQVRRLRAKLDRAREPVDAALPEIEAVRGRGYRLTVPARLINSAMAPPAA